MASEDPETRIAEATSAEGSFHPDGVNTPSFLTGTALKLWTAKLKLQRLVLLLCGLVLTALVFVQVVSRYLLGVSLFGIEEFAGFTAVFLYFFGASHGAWERGHISASLVDLVIPEGKPRQAMAIVTAAITSLLCVWMTVWGWGYLGFVISRGTVSLETDIPMYWIVAVMPVCLSLMSMYFLVELGLRISAFRSGGQNT